MEPIRSLRELAGLTQAALARAGGTSQSTVAAYESGRKNPTFATVRRLAESVGLEPSVHYHPPMTREERRSLALHGAIANKLREDPERTLAAARRNLACMREGPGSASVAVREWEVLLQRPLAALLPVLTDPSPWARELRQVTPFGGILTAGERAAVYRRFQERERDAAVP